MREVAEREAEKRLALLLDEVERGEAITIVREGKKVAEMKPVPAEQDAREPRRMASRAEVRAAMQRIRENAREAGMKFDLEQMKVWREEGRA